MSSRRRILRNQYMWIGAAIGAVAGAAVGSRMGNISLALGLGAAIGMILEQAMYFRN